MDPIGRASRRVYNARLSPGGPAVLTLIEFLAVISSAVFGILLARRKQMDFVGIYSVACITAFGGGTLRDVLLDRHPMFWIKHAHYPMIVFGIAVVGTLLPRLPGSIERWLNVPDALGLGLFSLVGAGYALEGGTTYFIAALLGVITGTFGGVIGDVVCNDVPSLFRPSTPLYATCSFVGCWVFLGLNYLHVGESIGLACGIAVIVALRMIALKWDLRLPASGAE